MKNTFSHLLRDDPGLDERAVKEALVVLDTNVLLDFYGRTPENREARFKTLEEVGDRLRIPYQVGIEFHRNRVSETQKLQKAYADAFDAVSRMENSLKNFGSSKYQESQAAVASAGSASAERLRAELTKIKGGDPHSIDALADPLLRRIEALLEDRVLPPPSAGKIRKRVRRFVTYRLPYQVPPGYADASKKSPMHAAGDYLLWAEILSLAKREDRSVLLVSDDRKGDWVQKGSLAHPDQPRPELLAEFKECTVATTAFYHQMTLKTFLAKANEFLGVAVSDEVLKEEQEMQEVAQRVAKGEAWVRRNRHLMQVPAHWLGSSADVHMRRALEKLVRDSMPTFQGTPSDLLFLGAMGNATDLAEEEAMLLADELGDSDDHEYDDHEHDEFERVEREPDDPDNEESFDETH